MDKYLLIIGGGILQVPAVEVAHEMGLKVIVADKSLDAPAMKNADVKAALSTKDIEATIAYAKEFAKTHNLVGVYTQGCDVEVTVAEVAAALGLPGIDVESAHDCNNKIRMRERLAKHNVAGPKFDFAFDYEEAKEKALKIGYPLVVKSVDNSASRGVRIIDNEAHLKEACGEAQKYSFYDKRILLEECLVGEEYSVDTVVYENILYPAGISDREFGKTSYLSKEFAIQTGSLTPSQLPEEMQEKMYQLMSDAAKAMGVDKGAFKGDLIICNGEPKIIEITARLSGGFDSQYRKPYSFGINLIKATMDIAIGNQLDFRDLIPKWVKYSKTTSPFPKAGKIVAIKGIEETKKLAGVKQVIMIVKEGDVVEDYKHCANRVGYIIVTGDSYEQLKEREKKALETLVIETVDIPLK